MKNKYTGSPLNIFWLCYFAFAVLLSLCSCGDNGNNSFQIDRTLNWFGNHSEDGVTATNFAFSINSQNGDIITGIIAWNGLGPAVYTDCTGTISGMKITLSWTGDGTSITLKGTIAADGTRMTGTWTSSDGTSGVWYATGGHAVAD